MNNDWSKDANKKREWYNIYFKYGELLEKKEFDSVESFLNEKAYHGSPFEKITARYFMGVFHLPLGCGNRSLLSRATLFDKDIPLEYKDSTEAFYNFELAYKYNGINNDGEYLMPLAEIKMYELLTYKRRQSFDEAKKYIELIDIKTVWDDDYLSKDYRSLLYNTGVFLIRGTDLQGNQLVKPNHEDAVKYLETALKIDKIRNAQNSRDIQRSLDQLKHLDE